MHLCSEDWVTVNTSVLALSRQMWCKHQVSTQIRSCRRNFRRAGQQQFRDGGVWLCSLLWSPVDTPLREERGQQRGKDRGWYRLIELHLNPLTGLSALQLHWFLRWCRAQITPSRSCHSVGFLRTVCHRYLCQCTRLVLKSWSYIQFTRWA